MHPDTENKKLEYLTDANRKERNNTVCSTLDVSGHQE